MSDFGAINWLGLMFFIVFGLSAYSITLLFFGLNARKIYKNWIKECGDFVFPVWAIYLGWAIAFGFIVPSGYLAWAARIDHELVAGEVVVVDDTDVKRGFYYAGLVLYFVSVIFGVVWTPATFYSMAMIDPDIRGKDDDILKIRNGIISGIAMLVIAFVTGIVADVFFFLIWHLPGGLFIPYLVWLFTLFVLSLLMLEGVSHVPCTPKSSASPRRRGEEQEEELVDPEGREGGW